MRLGLYGRELIAVDGSRFKAVNSRKRDYTERRIQDKTAKMTAKTGEYLEELDRNDAAEGGARGENGKEEITKITGSLRRHKQRYEGYAAELEQTGEKQKSLTGADSRLTRANGKMDVCYNVQTAAGAKHKLPVDFEAANQGNDKNLITPMARSVQEALGAESMAVVADGGYESIQDIISAQGCEVDAHVAGQSNAAWTPDTV